MSHEHAHAHPHGHDHAHDHAHERPAAAEAGASVLMRGAGARVAGMPLEQALDSVAEHHRQLLANG